MTAGDVLRGNTRFQRWRREYALRHPVRTDVEAGVIWSSLMWLTLVRRFSVLALMVFVFGAVLFGLGIYWALLKERNRSSAARDSIR
jgi:hypothetical protein